MKWNCAQNPKECYGIEKHQLKLFSNFAKITDRFLVEQITLDAVYPSPIATSPNGLPPSLPSPVTLGAVVQGWVNPLTPMSDQDSISPYNVNTIWSR